jgi:hypothetical protein
MVSKFFLKPLVTIPVAPITTGIITHFMFHIHCISIHKLLYFSLFFASFCVTFLSAVLPHLSACMFSLFLNYYIWPICCNICVCSDSITLSHLHVHTLVRVCVCVCVCVYHLSVLSMPSALHIK